AVHPERKGIRGAAARAHAQLARCASRVRGCAGAGGSAGPGGGIAQARSGVSATPWAYAIAAAAANVVGAAAVTWRSRWSVATLETLVALSAGFMIAVSLTDIFPEAIARSGDRGAMAALLGYLLVHFTQHTLAPHFHFGEETHHVTERVGVSALVACCCTRSWTAWPLHRRSW